MDVRLVNATEGDLSIPDFLRSDIQAEHSCACHENYYWRRYVWGHTRKPVVHQTKEEALGGG